MRVFDEAGNETLAPAGSIEVLDCEAIMPCLFRATTEILDPTDLFVSPRPPSDVAFAPPNDTPYAPCPFASGELDPEMVLGEDAPPLIYYQVDGAGIVLRVTAERALGTVRLTF